ncbi:hypothetical protein Pogu_1190 [Pyrobaculum oguniense TE7]|uniref:Uncharacterized protein n=1 Tax=Pyrobaculum oguniense (strain DSM 13380 / JCM 10595 / TE7) TaxID=698757 RepID=H6Q8R2_PYROT|nr:hypothetical protein Pogu_1190 [Pyrobaculum oguniense TE7]
MSLLLGGNDVCDSILMRENGVNQVIAAECSTGNYGGNAEVLSR